MAYKNQQEFIDALEKAGELLRIKTYVDPKLEMAEITEDRPIYTRGNFWAEPSIEHAASLMRAVFERPEGARARALQAQPEIQRLLSLAAAGRRMRARLQAIVAD